MVGSLGSTCTGLICRAGRSGRKGRGFARRNTPEISGQSKDASLAEAKQRVPANLSAYDLYLLGREQSDLGTKEGNAKGLEYADKAIALDPNLASAYVTRAWLKLQKYWLFGVPSSLPAAEKEFEKDLRLALALNPSDAGAHAGLI